MNTLLICFLYWGISFTDVAGFSESTRANNTIEFLRADVDLSVKDFESRRRRKQSLSTTGPVGTRERENQLAQVGPEADAVRQAEINAWRASRHETQGRAEEDFGQKLEIEHETNRRKIEQRRAELRSIREKEEETRRTRQEEAETRHRREKEEIERRKHNWL